MVNTSYVLFLHTIALAVFLYSKGRDPIFSFFCKDLTQIILMLLDALDFNYLSNLVFLQLTIQTL